MGVYSSESLLTWPFAGAMPLPRFDGRTLTFPVATSRAIEVVLFHLLSEEAFEAAAAAEKEERESRRDPTSEEKE